MAADSPAARAGFAVGDYIRAVDDQPLTDDPLVLARAVAGRDAAIACLVKPRDGGWLTRTLACPDGLRLPWLERRPGGPDRLSAILAPQARRASATVATP